MTFAVQSAFDYKKNKFFIPNNYKSYLDVRETVVAINKLKAFFQINLAKELNLTKVEAPCCVKAGLGINDDLNGVEIPVSFNIRSIIGSKVEIVHSLAKWKRLALLDYGFKSGEGLYTNMSAIRSGEELDNLHSIFVDQWDWERIIDVKERNLAFLKWVVRKIYDVIHRTENFVYQEHAQITPFLPKKITFLHSEDLLEKFPDLSPRERENIICKKKGAVFIIGIGGHLKDGRPHDSRAPDYDDWSTPTKENYRGLNGDLLLWYPLLNKAVEISSMGIRVDKETLNRQLSISGNSERKKLQWHSSLLSGELPLAIGGGIGQSRLCMFLLRKAHIGEVQCGIWSEDLFKKCREKGIFLL